MPIGNVTSRGNIRKPASIKSESRPGGAALLVGKRKENISLQARDPAEAKRR